MNLEDTKDKRWFLGLGLASMMDSRSFTDAEHIEGRGEAAGEVNVELVQFHGPQH